MGDLGSSFVIRLPESRQRGRVRLGDRERQVLLAQAFPGRDRQAGVRTPCPCRCRGHCSRRRSRHSGLRRWKRGSASPVMPIIPYHCASNSTSPICGNVFLSARFAQARWTSRPARRSAPMLPNRSRPALSKRNEFMIEPRVPAALAAGQDRGRELGLERPGGEIEIGHADLLPLALRPRPPSA